MIYIHLEVGQLSRSNFFRIMEVTSFWIKENITYNKNFPQLPESFENYSSEYNGCISVIKCI